MCVDYSGHSPSPFKRFPICPRLFWIPVFVRNCKIGSGSRINWSTACIYIDYEAHSVDNVKHDSAKWYSTAVLFQFYRGNFDIKDGHDRTVNVSTFHQLYAACEQILVLRFDKKHKRYLYCRILWSKLQICWRDGIVSAKRLLQGVLLPLHLYPQSLLLFGVLSLMIL